PTRLAVGLVNFAFFAIAEVVIFSSLLARRGLVTALLGLGFFLLCLTHYYHSGGMFDVRLDYGGMTLMGATFIGALTWLETGASIALIGAVLALLLSVGTRSILGVYWVGALAVCLACCLVPITFHVPARKRYLQIAKRSLVLLIAAIAIFAIYVGMFWTQFHNYYINCKADGEDLMRLRENNVKTLVDRLSYYPRSFLDHFIVPIGVALVSALSTLGIKMACTNGAKPTTGLEGDDWPGSRVPLLLLFAAVVLTVYVCATYYVPTPVVIGVLAIPISITAAILIGSINMPRSANRWMVTGASIVLVAGIGRYVKEFTRPTFIAQPNRLLCDAVNSTMSAVSERVVKNGGKRTTIFWCLVHDGINQEYFKIYFAEHYHRLWPESMVQDLVHAYPKATLSSLREKIDTADVVVIPTELPQRTGGQFEYDGSESVRQYLPQLLPILNRDFRPVLKTYFFQTPSSMPGALVVFERIK
ncbi:MAG TPA: hypothetical protein V6C72_13460, partial [Chroococcales cyanobacterium]